MMAFTRQNFAIGLVPALMTLSAVAQANTAFSFSVKNQEAYEVVIASDSGNSTLAPGVYAIDKKSGDSQPIMLGEIPGVSRSFKGILAHVGLDSRDSAHDVLVQIDGRVVLLNQNSRQNSARSFLPIVGSKDSVLKITDLLTGQPVQVPAAQSREEVNAYVGETNVSTTSSRTQALVLVSVKSPSPLGSGLTMAMVVNKGRGTDKVSVVNNRAIVIAYDFYDEEQLRRIANDDAGLSNGIFAPTVLHSVAAQLERRPEITITQRWLRLISSFKDYLVTGKRNNFISATGVPTFDVLTAMTKADYLPIEMIGGKSGSYPPAHIGQVFDPISQEYRLIRVDKNASELQVISNGKDEFFVVPRETIVKNTILNGSIERFKTNRFKLFGQAIQDSTGHLNESYVEALVAYFTDSGAQLIVPPSMEGGQYQSFPLTKFGQSEHIELIRTAFQPQDQSASLQVVLISRKKARGEGGEVWSAVIQNGVSMRMLSFQKIYDGGFVSAMEMKLRLIRNSNGDLLFDNITPAKGDAAYLKRIVSETKKAENPDHDAALTPRSEKSTKEVDVDIYSSENNIARSTPYLRLLYGTMLKGIPESASHAQIYLRSIDQIDALGMDGFAFKRFDNYGAAHNATGFYMKRPAGKDGVKTPDQFIQGDPLASLILKPKPGTPRTFFTDVKTLDFYSQSDYQISMPLKVGIFPFSEQLIKPGTKISEIRQFQLGFALTAQSYPGTTPPSDGSVHTEGYLYNLKITLPYSSFAFSKIIQGAKDADSEFYIILAFRKDDKVLGSKDAVIVVPGHIRWKHDDPRAPFTVEYGKAAQVSGQALTPNVLNSHLKVDARGAYYWLDYPDAKIGSASYAVRKLIKPDEVVSPRVTSVQTLREPENIKDAEFGFGNKKYRHGGRWEIFSVEALKKTVDGLDDHLKGKQAKYAKAKHSADDEAAQEEQDGKEGKKTKKEWSDQVAAKNSDDQIMERRFFKAFDNMLTNYADKSEKEEVNRPQVVLVDPALKNLLRFRLYERYAGDKGGFSHKNFKFSFYLADNSLNDVEISHELKHIAHLSDDKRKILVVESELLRNAEIETSRRRQSENEGEEGAKDEDEFAESEGESKASLAVLLTTGGEAKSVRGFKQGLKKGTRVPSLTIATPQEWREIQAIHRRENEAGVFDEFSINYDFLTSPWTMWPPKSSNFSEELKPLTKLTYNPEEMSVFPSLDETLRDAAEGRLTGKQKIILVPKELKPIVQKLITLRWLDSYGYDDSWNHSNDDLALYRIMGKDGSQLAIMDAFKAVVGSAQSKNSVLYADLDTVMRLGRPVGSPGSRTFVLRDPIKRSNSLVMEREDAAEQARAEREQQRAIEEDNTSLQELIQERNDILVMIEELRHELENTEKEVRNSSPDDDQLINQMEDLAEQIEEHVRTRDELNELIGEIDQPEFTNNSGSLYSDRTAPPHVLWWIATEGRTVQPKRTRGWNVTDAVHRDATTILVGTEEELANIEMNMAFESKFFDIRKHFQIEHLQPPTEATKFNLVNQLFDRPEVQAMGIEFTLKENNGRDPRSQLIYHFINRIDQLAYDQKIEQTSAFIKSYIAFKNSLVEDVELRKHRRIDERYVERLFTKVFPMALNPDILDANDPLQVVRNIDSAVRELQKAGYEGSQDLKRRVFETMLSQTRPTDSSRPIPNSQILFGTTSTGKTFLLQKIFQMLKLVEYNPNKASNEEADYIFINVAKLTHEDSTQDPDKIPIKEAIAQIMDLMSGPKGARASIVFDDFHKATSKEVRQKLSQFIQGLFEANNGMITVRSKDGKRIREIPVQNLNVYMTINPTSNERTRSEWLKDHHKGAERLKREVLAAIADDSFKPEESFLARWADIIPMDTFPRAAKVPELVKRVRSQSTSSGQMTLVNADVIDALLDRFPNSHARELLAPASAALTDIPSSALDSKLYIVSMKEHAKPLPPFDDLNGGQINLQELQSAVRQITQVDPVSLKEPKSMLRLMAFIMKNFRLQIANNLALETQISDTLRLSKSGLSNLLKNTFLMGVTTHVLSNPSLPAGEMILQPDQLGFMSRAEIDELFAHFAQLKKDSDYFPLNLDRLSIEDNFNLDSFLKSEGQDSTRAMSRLDVLVVTVRKLERIIGDAMVLSLRLRERRDLVEIGQWGDDKIRSWFENLPQQNPDAEFRKVMQSLLKAYTEFQIEFNSPDLRDLQSGAAFINSYDEVRLFMYAMEKAITRMPWAQVAKFMYSMVELSSDFQLGTRTQYKEYTTTHPISPFAITTSEFLTELKQAILQGNESVNEQMLEGLLAGFETTCEGLLTSGGGK